MSQYKKLLKNSFLFGIGSVGSRAITFLLLPIFTRYLSTEEYGEVDIIVTTILLLLPIISLQAQEISFRYSMDKKRDQRITLVNSIFLCIGGFLLLLLVEPLLAKVVVFKHLNVLFLVIFFAMTDSVLKQFSRGLGNIKIFVASDILYSLTFSVCIVIFVVFQNMGVKGYLISLLISYLSSNVLILFAGKAYIYLRIKSLNFQDLTAMLKYSIPLIPTAIMWWTINVSDRYLISYFVDYNANGIYAIASKIPIVLVTLNSIFFRSWQITAIEEKGKDSFLESFRRIFHALSITMIIFLSLLIICIKPLFRILTEGDFFYGWQYAPILLVGVLFSAFSQFWGVLYVVSKKTSGALWTATIGAIINLLLNLILIPPYGLYGAAIATLVAFIGLWLSRYFHIKNQEGIFVNLNHLFLPLILITVQILVLNYFQDITAFIINLFLFSLIVILNLKYIIENASYFKKIISSKLPNNE